MKYFFLRLLPVVLLVGFFAGCDAFNNDSGGIVTLSGQVLDAETNNPVSGAFVTIKPQNLLVETDSLGRYAVEIEIDSTMSLQVVAAKNGFNQASVTVQVLPDRLVEVPTLRITRIVDEEPVSGLASNILLLAQSTTSIGVKESGSEEVAKITFQVADSLGRPVILDKQARVRFTLGVRPGGGEFIFPESAPTDNNGQVTVNLSSGTKAGVVQIVAETEVEGRTIRSLPVSVSIHGGLPDQTHFSIGPARFNFPGLNTFGLTNAISVIVGDKYGNPVKPGTAVYFSTTHGIIEGSTQTDAQGRGSVSLISANPLPADGVAVITATTADENQNEVIGQTPVVFSGIPVVIVHPDTAALNQEYSLTVTDQNGNPLAQGTVISVRVEGTKVKGVGHTGVTLDDTKFIGGMAYENILRGPGITEFTFRAVEDRTLDEDGTPTVEAITIRVSGPNGALEIVLTASGEAQTRTEGATVERLGADVVRVRAGNP
ncbi:hypothetical protein GQ464_008560 [Rhodocaloribacter litoris]|uniref:hypothetical protein n=1 Tax=Rhodocaloribacter litoris TaxID=2558931 RepID=UPI001423F6F8|nr:hypothetical protein [Rhodocaloribacter litoris]QXD16970.1 hypothetical protein GQ464_008560 [Rhodocaloribacter litoris]